MNYIETLIHLDNKLPRNKFSLKAVLGDSFLLKENATYLQRRKTALEFKINFKKADDTYIVAALLCLPQILKSKTIPFLDNKNALLKLRIPQKKISVDDLSFLGIKENHLLHESSHVIMWQTGRANLDLKKQTDLMTAYLLSESYANYSEAIANCHALTQIQIDFLTLNSFWSHSESEIELLSKFRKKHGAQITHVTLFLCFLYANFLYKKISIYECEGIRTFLGNKAMNLRIPEIKKIFSIASQLNAHFIMKTGEIFWKTLGIEENLFETLDFDPVEFILENPGLQKSLLDLLSKDSF